MLYFHKSREQAGNQQIWFRNSMFYVKRILISYLKQSRKSNMKATCQTFFKHKASSLESCWIRFIKWKNTGLSDFVSHYNLSSVCFICNSWNVSNYSICLTAATNWTKQFVSIVVLLVCPSRHLLRTFRILCSFIYLQIQSIGYENFGLLHLNCLNVDLPSPPW